MLLRSAIHACLICTQEFIITICQSLQNLRRRTRTRETHAVVRVESKVHDRPFDYQRLLTNIVYRTTVDTSNS